MVSTSAGLFGRGVKELVSDCISHVFVSILEGWSGMETGEGFDGVIEVSMSHLVRNPEVQLFSAHAINNKLL
jgi:hypothetical protein